MSSPCRVPGAYASGSICLAARGATPSSHRERRGARLARRDDREYGEYLSEEQRRQTGCIAVRMQMELHHGLLEGVPYILAPLTAFAEAFRGGGSGALQLREVVLPEA